MKKLYFTDEERRAAENARARARRQADPAYTRERYLRVREKMLARLAEKRRAAGIPEQHKLSRTPAYKAWQSIKERCFNERCPFYDRYGGRGITMHPGWRDDPVAFCHYMGPRPSARHSIDRIDNNGQYAPGNIRWATYEEQNRNRRCSKLDEWDVKLIRHWLKKGYRHVDIAQAFDVTSSHISMIGSGQHWVGV
jgi:hypothetical protein